jgi:hypothetical protein
LTFGCYLAFGFRSVSGTVANGCRKPIPACWFGTEA